MTTSSTLATLKAGVEEGFDLRQASVSEQLGHSIDSPSYALPLLNVACRFGDQALAALAIEAGCDAMAFSCFGFMPLHEAAQGGHTPLLEWLLATVPGCRLDIEAQIGATVLHIAAGSGHLETVKWLIGAGADPLLGLVDAGGSKHLPSSVARGRGHEAVAVFLRQEEEKAQAAKAAGRAEQEAAARRARNEKRRQKQKKAKARRQAAAGSGDGEQDQEGREEEGEGEEAAAEQQGVEGEPADVVAAAEVWSGFVLDVSSRVLLVGESRA
jgi:hypothetical protein